MFPNYRGTLAAESCNVGGFHAELPEVSAQLGIHLSRIHGHRDTRTRVRQRQVQQ